MGGKGGAVREGRLSASLRDLVTGLAGEAVTSRVWELNDSRRSVEEITRVIVEEFDVAPQDAAQDVRGFV